MATMNLANLGLPGAAIMPAPAAPPAAPPAPLGAPAAPAALGAAPGAPGAPPKPEPPYLYVENNITCPQLLALLQGGCGTFVKARKQREKRPKVDEPELEAMATPAEDRGELRAARADGAAYEARAKAADGLTRADVKERDTPATGAAALADIRELGTLRVARGAVASSGEPLEPMTDSTKLLQDGDAAALWRRYDQDGYVLLRGVVAVDAVVAARKAFVAPLVAEGGVVDAAPLLDDVVAPPPEAVAASLGAADPARARAAALADERAAPNAKGYTVMVDSGDAIRGRDKHHDASQQGDAKRRWRDACLSADARAPCEDAGLEDALRLLARGRALVEAEEPEESEEPAAKRSRLGAHARACGVDFTAEAASEPDAAPEPPAGGYRVAFFDPKFTWVRLKAPGEQTVEHADVYHFERETGLFTGAADDVSPAPEAPEPDDDEPCAACGSADDPGRLLLCDECDAAYHTSCLDPPLDASPPGDWFCPKCAVRPAMGTVWLPLQDVDHRNGGLVVLRGSHKALDYAPGAYRDAPLPKTFFKRGGSKLDWRAATFAPGDVVLFSVHAIHATPKNRTKAFRASIDTRFLVEPSPDLAATRPRKWAAYVANAVQDDKARLLE